VRVTGSQRGPLCARAWPCHCQKAFRMTIDMVAVLSHGCNLEHASEENGSFGNDGARLQRALTLSRMQPRRAVSFVQQGCCPTANDSMLLAVLAGAAGGQGLHGFIGTVHCVSGTTGYRVTSCGTRLRCTVYGYESLKVSTARFARRRKCVIDRYPCNA
jgi:hypothetical protein